MHGFAPHRCGEIFSLHSHIPLTCDELDLNHDLTDIGLLSSPSPANLVKKLGTQPLNIGINIH